MTADPNPRTQVPATIESVTADYSSSTLLVDEMLADLIANGSTVYDACRTVGYGRMEFYRRLRKDADFAHLMDDAQAAGADAQADMSDRIAAGDREAGSTGDWRRDQLIVKQRQWRLSKQHVKRYGDKLQVESTNVNANVPISDDPIEASRQYAAMMDRT
jgi:hypothetical protein